LGRRLSAAAVQTRHRLGRSIRLRKFVEEENITELGDRTKMYIFALRKAYRCKCKGVSGGFSARMASGSVSGHARKACFDEARKMR
jgi:hypothetical protein